jgi:STE24 endopeptidase
MSIRNFLLGAAGGFAAGYAAYRVYEAFAPPAAAAPRKEAARYGALRRSLTVANIVNSAAASALVAYGPLGKRMERSVQRAPLFLRAGLFAAEGALLEAIGGLGSDYVEGFALEHRFGLSDQTLPSWFADKAKEEGLGAAIGMVLATLFSWAVRRFPNSWPYIASAGVLPLLLAANVVVPIYVLPMFNTYTPIEGSLERRLRALASRYGVGDAEILRMDMSKQTKKANAFVTGIGSTHRIVVGDTLIEHFPEEEIEFVVAHELGHYVAKDSWRMIAMGQISAMAVLFACFAVLGDRSRERLERPTTLAQLAFTSMLVSQMMRPAIAAFVRSREWAADRFALHATNAPQTGKSAFRRLRDQNLAEDEQPAWFEFFFATHPSLKKRIDALSAARVRA